MVEVTRDHLRVYVMTDLPSGGFHHCVISRVEYQSHLNWSATMVQYMNDLPKLSVELEQLKEHTEELKVSHNINTIAALVDCCHRRRLVKLEIRKVR